MSVEHEGLSASSYSTSTPTSSRNINSSSPNTTQTPGVYYRFSRLSKPYLSLPRWHEHDADEIQQHADLCVEEAIKGLEAAGWAKNSVKVIGTPP
jgi:hypothetical protein